ncbi:MAG TPA: hypothetical protein VF743_07145, partial [Acidimicrobiales bacterium]
MVVTRWLLVALGIGLLAASGCAGSGYQYVKNEDLGVFAKVPDDWTIYEGEEVFAAVSPAGTTEAETERAMAGRWFRGFDASDDPSPEATMQLGGETPRGYVQILQLTRAQRDQINITSMRSAVLGVDPLAAPDPQSPTPAPDVQVVTDEPAEFDGGYHGVHTVFATPGDEGIAVVDQTALLNKTNSVLYLFVVTCDEDCYFETRSDEINDIVDSWT